MNQKEHVNEVSLETIADLLRGAHVIICDGPNATHLKLDSEGMEFELIDRMDELNNRLYR